MNYSLLLRQDPSGYDPVCMNLGFSSLVGRTCVSSGLCPFSSFLVTCSWPPASSLEAPGVPVDGQRSLCRLCLPHSVLPLWSGLWTLSSVSSTQVDTSIHPCCSVAQKLEAALGHRRTPNGRATCGSLIDHLAQSKFVSCLYLCNRNSVYLSHGVFLAVTFRVRNTWDTY